MMKTRLSRHRVSRPFTGKDVLNVEAKRKKLEKSYLKTEQEGAFKDLIKLMAANEGKVPYGDLNKLIKSYEEAGCKGVTRSNLYYRLNLWKKDAKAADPLLGASAAVSSKTLSATSELTGETFTSIRNDPLVIPETPVDVVPETPEEETNFGGRSKGSTKAASLLAQQRHDEVVTKCALFF